MSLIKCKNVTLGYEGKEVIRNISFDVQKGNYLCVIGENGSGKTTLLNGLMGFIKPYSGSISISSSGIGYLPQRFETHGDFPVSVKEVVLSGCLSNHRFNPFYNKSDKFNAQKSAEKLEISNLMNNCYSELSGGQKQRVLLARALCAAKDLIILDEPLQGLDPIISNELYDVIYRLNRNENMTVITISHDIKSSLKYASHILHIGNGFYYFGTRDEYTKSRFSDSLRGGDYLE